MNSGHHKTIFSKRLGCLVAVGEHASSQGKANGAASGQFSGFAGSDWLSTVLQFVGVLTASCALVTLAWAGPVASTALSNSLPTGGQVAQGAAAISQSGAVMNITQSTPKAVVNWNTFDIGQNAKVNIVQPGANAVMLNRVTSGNPSQILGQLNANGQVVLVNPNGVLFGKDGSVNASSFTASSLGISDANFMAGNNQFERNGSTAAVVNQGRINTTGGYVALLGASVSNEGQINTQGGTAYLAAAETVKIPVSGSGRIKLELSPSRINAAVANSKTGTIVTEGGQVYMQAASLSTMVASIIQSGNIDTTGEQGGAVHLLVDGGQIKVDGSVTANTNAAGNKGGDIVIGRDEITGVLARATDVSGAKLESLGGFVETSGDYLKTDGISVKAKDWLLDPTDINIRATATTTLTASSSVSGTNTFQDTTVISTSEVLTSTIKSAIDNGTNVTISTANTTSGANGSGNITIFDKLDFANNSGRDATLTLLAKNGVTQNTGAFIKQTAGSNNNKVDVVMKSEGLHGDNSAPSTSSKGITLNAAITTNGDVTLHGTTNNSGLVNNFNAIGVDIKAAATITANNIEVKGKSESSFGIQSASVMNATDKITLDGTSKNYVGVVTTAAVTADGALKIDGHKTTATTTAASYQGININSAVKGASVAITGDSVGHYGVGIGTLGSVESTGTPVSGSTSSGPGDVTIIGTGTGNTTMGANNNAVGVQVRGNITAKGKLSITGTKDGAGGFQGVTFSDSKTMKGDSIEITAKSNAWDAVTFTNATLTATKTLTVDADSTAVGKGILFSGGSTNTFTADSYLVKAKTAVNNGIWFSGTNTFNSTSTTTDSLIDVTRTTAGGDTIHNAGTLTINSGAGKATLQTSTTNVGGGIRINGGSTVNTTGDVTIGSKNSSNSYTFNQGTINAQSGNLTLLGKTHSANNVNAGVWMQNAGTAVAKIIGTNGANITIDGTNTSSDAGVSLSVHNSANSISTTGVSSTTGAVGNISITGTSASGHGISNAASELKNTSTNSSTGAKGNITLTGTTQSGSGQGIYNVAAGANAGLNVIYAAGDLTLIGNSVNNHAVNNSGTLEAGGLLKIEGTANPTVPLLNATSVGIYVGNTAKGGTVSMTGTTGGSKGIEINAAVASTVGDITLTGTGGGNYYFGQGVVINGPTVPPAAAWAGGSINSAAGVTIKGTATASGNNITTIGTQIQGTVTAAADILVEGKNTATTPNVGLSIEKTIQSTGGNITLKAENTSGTKTALTLNANGKLLTDAANSAININTNGMDLATGALVQAGSAGTGKVDIKTIGNNNISVGGGDGPSNSAVSQTLGINNTELGQIKAGNLVIGDASKTGNITVSGSVSTASTTGNITLQTGGNIFVDQALTVVDSTKKLTLKAGVNITDNDTTGVIKASNLELLGTNAAVTLDSKKHEVVTLAADVKSLNFANKTALILGAVNTINSADQTTGTVGIKAKEGVNVTTQTGDLTLSKSINNQSSGNVIVGAGVSKGANDTSGGDVKTATGKGITHTNGNLYVYSGSAANTDALSNLDSTNFATLKVDGTAGQNADTNMAYNAGAGITGSTARAQVLFREKVSTGDVGLSGTTVDKTYGDATTANGSDAALFAETKASLKAANTGSYTIGTGLNSIVIDKAVVIDSMTGNLSGPTYNSTNTYLKAATHDYGVLSSSKYTTQNIAANAVQVTVAKRALTGSIAQGNTTYGDALVAGAVTFTNKVGSDDVSANGVTFTTTGKTSTSGNLKADTHADVQSVKELTGDDKGNYTFANVKGSYQVEQKSLTGSIAQGNTTYGDTLVAGDVTLTNKVGADVVVANAVNFTTTGKTSTSGNLKAGTHVDVQSVASLTGADAANYSFANVKGSYKVTPRAISGSVSGVTTVYGTAATTGLASIDVLLGDDVVANQAVVLNGQALSSSNNLKVGTYLQSVGGGLGGADAGNYTFSGASSANYVVTKLALNTQIAGVTTTYGTAAATGAASVSGVLSDDKVDLGNAKATLVNAVNSSSGNLKAGTYQQTVANSLNGVDADNYTAAPTSLANYVVTPKAIAATVTAADKVYDGNNVATLNANSAGILTGDVVNVLGATGTFASKNVARDGAGNVVAQTVTVTGTGVGLGGTDGANYTLTNATNIASTTAKITPKDLSVSGITASDKVYDGSTAAAINSANALLSGVVSGDSVSVSTQSGVGNFASKDVAFDGAGVVASQAVTVSGLSLNGTAAGNYNVTDKSGVKAKVLQRALSITGSVAQDKTVDGNTNAQVKPGQLGNLVAGESLVVSATGQFADAEIGTNKAVTTQYALANGVNGVARNYSLAGEVLRAAILVASINPVQSIVNPSRTPSGGRVVVSGSGNSGAALGVADGEEEIISREECSVLNPEKCECQESTIAGVEMCFAPTLAANTKN